MKAEDKGQRSEVSALQRAAELYARYKVEPDFFTALVDHLHTGMVISRPNCFAMGKAVALDDGRIAWFIDTAVGNLRELLGLLQWPLPYIAFCRRGKGKIKVYPFDKFIRKARSIC